MNASINNDEAKRSPGVSRKVYLVGEVAEITGLAVPTVYEIARENPERLGVVRFGRSVRFRRDVIDGIVEGEV